MCSKIVQEKHRLATVKCKDSSDIGALLNIMDPKLLIDRVDAAEAAIHGRLRDLRYDSDHQKNANSWEMHNAP